jgi:hypothetical protein
MIQWSDFMQSCHMRRIPVNTSSSGIHHLRQASNVHTNERELVGLGRKRCGPHPGTNLAVGTQTIYLARSGFHCQALGRLLDLGKWMVYKARLMISQYELM